jgi:hypothetical protein
MYILIEVLTTSKDGEAKAQNRRGNKIMPTGCSKNLYLTLYEEWNADLIVMANLLYFGNNY